MRKQGAQSFVVESAISLPDIVTDVDSLDGVNGGGGSAEALAVSFFKVDLSNVEITSATDEDFLGQVIVVNYRKPGSSDFDVSYIFEAVLPPPSLRKSGDQTRLLNNFVCSDGEFKRTVKGRDFAVKGVYYCQQNSLTHVCAHSCLRMVLNTVDGQSGLLTSASINNSLGIVPPLAGLRIDQIEAIINSRADRKAFVIDCSTIDSQMYVSALAAIVESGFPALLVFTTGDAGVEHVVTVFGHTRNTDQWHPQAIPAYAGPTSAPYYTGAAWISHFLIHDDNFGPYYTLSNRALDSNPSVQAHWIIAVMPTQPTIPPHLAEVIGAYILSNNLSSWAPLAQGRWFDYITRSNWTYVLRTILVSKQAYLDHLKAAKAHDNSAATTQDYSNFDSLPDQFWMVEFSLPSLFLGNRSKLGEVLIHSKGELGDNPLDLVIGARVPSFAILFNPPHQFQFGIASHIPMYELRPHDHIW